MKLKQWIRHRAATEQALNLSEVARERPDLIEEAYAAPAPRGWRRCLIDAGVDPYKIFHMHEEVVECCKRIIQSHFHSLKRLAEMSGIDPKTVAIEIYRDETDVHHDLDLLEKAGKPLCFDTLRQGYKRLYNVIRETGWGGERLETKP